MPKLYEYFGLIILFYSNEHEPIHVHGKYQGAECKAEIILDKKRKIVKIKYSSVSGKRLLNNTKIKHFKKIVENYKEEIIQKWIDYFVFHKPIKIKKISQKIL
jgi:hypothetical protein